MIACSMNKITIFFVGHKYTKGFISLFRYLKYCDNDRKQGSLHFWWDYGHIIEYVVLYLYIYTLISINIYDN